MEPTPPVLFFLGATHHTAPLAVREKLALDEARTAALAAKLQTTPGVKEFAFVNTCNRVELYGVGDAGVFTGFTGTLAEVTGCSHDEISAVVKTHTGHHAIEHLFSVAAGLDSQIVGETEILGQVKNAYDKALACHWTGPVLNRVFQKTFQAAKHIRTHTRIGEGQVSVASVAVDLAGKIFGDLAPVKVLVVGAGDIGLKTAQAFQSRGAKAITVASRTLSRAEETAAATGGWAASLAELPELVTGADIVASSTSAPGLVLPRDLVAAAMKRRAGRPLFLIDLALPRDIDPAAAELANVFLYNLDDLAKIAEENIAHREAEVARCRAILAERTAALWPQVARSLVSGGS
ncbi:glutamyl-tRNA reductase [Oleiharenicola lentus]|uniref:Glutamyl-tRNA reductase n=1 Tax=Oleiharenicola lentus TaxID=2508720 RepID=A0A4Q1C3F1_9BACT|nr:glutamyl-tRNA reductase [Oleiharenicola lentus]RXK52860.1 glutamyl-tRNA reductase [Oleiharenicola lentus]